MSVPPAIRIPAHLQALRSVIASVVAPDGRLLEANRGFLELQGRDGEKGLDADASSLFLRPTFEDLRERAANASPGGAQAIFEGILHLGPPSGIAQSVLGTVYAEGGALLLIAEHDVREYAQLAESVLALNEQLTETQRGLLREVRERKRAEEAQRAATAYARGLIEATLDPLVAVDPDGRIADVNEAFERMTGKDRAQLVGARFADHFEDSREAARLLEEARAAKTVRDLHLVVRHRDGARTEVLCNAAAREGASREADTVLVAARDVTERLRLENALAEERERAWKAERFASFAIVAEGVAHEINNPLTALGTNLALLQLSLGRVDRKAAHQGGLREDIERSLESVGEAVEAVSRIDRIVRALKRVSTRRRRAAARLDLGRLVEASVARIREEATGAASFHVETAPGIEVLAEAGELSDALDALLKNAAEAAAEGGGHVRASVEADAREVRVVVADDGPGMSEAVLSRLFTPFFTTKPASLGLDLALAQATARSCGGEVRASSREGEGSRFTLHLPLAPGAPPP